MKNVKEIIIVSGGGERWEQRETLVEIFGGTLGVGVAEVLIYALMLSDAL